MCHVYGFICYSCVELKFNIKIKIAFNQALNPVYPWLLNSRCWPWGVVSSWRVSHHLGTARPSYLVRVGPVAGPCPRSSLKSPETYVTSSRIGWDFCSHNLTRIRKRTPYLQLICLHPCGKFIYLKERQPRITSSMLLWWLRTHMEHLRKQQCKLR